MLDVSERQLILDRFLAREKKEKKIAVRKERIDAGKAEKSDVRWLLDEQSAEITNKMLLIRLLKENNADWSHFLFRAGYVYPIALDSDLKGLEDELKERKENIRKRYLCWKNLRHYLRKNGSTVDESLFPAYKHSIYQFLYDDNAHAYMLFFMMVVNYIPLYELYMYDPVPGCNHGYRYYSGEKIIIYQFNKKLADDRHYRMRVRRAISAVNANGYDLKDVYKVVLCNFDWNVLDVQKGRDRQTGSFKLFVLNPNMPDFYKSCLIYWKDYSENDPFFNKFNVLLYARSERVLPWPYMVKDGKLVLLDSVKEFLGDESEKTSRDKI